MSPIEVHMVPCLKDNYGFLLHVPASLVTAAVDTPEVEPILRALAEKGWALTYIFNTHHHGDHAGGNLPIKAATGCKIVGPRSDAGRIPGIDIEVGDGDRFDFGDHEVEVFETPGHTRGHIVYLLREERLAFVGDTLFAMGCGRLFEGSPGQVPTTLALEKATNPFLRPSSRNLRETVGLPDATDVEVFARTRALKDAF